MSKKQYEEFEDRLVFREASSGAIVIVLFLAFILFPLVIVSILINVNLVFTVLILGSGFMLWLVWRSFTLCKLILKPNEKVLIHECIHSLSKKKRAKVISFSKIKSIQIDISDELYGGTSDREMYEVVKIKFLAQSGEEFYTATLKANREFRNDFNSIEKLVNKLQTFTNLPHNVFSYTPHSFLGVEK
ncbi:MAG: hypothetical protein IM550_14530 [Microcystis sp. M54BS1]|uniref:hypothetical protein n=1 Tax=unclassified Microcystis TaxID=2643300 RepID=UPI0025799CD2|nr:MULTISPECIES: hypothetical protein [unclassified Microcystis]MCA2540384.1 hypothetical protein [Microcystis sp. M54BS1]MCA2598459.1 hypothetical protein [Microcystis sp. M38BS1]MCA2610939.1 hypothetical protein [Microcystis sp. M27BS1]MCA2504550.1 hypothetical protein [Microcystis sp. M62BS1]MCA2512891.1 hypothetical protein [Microcystis sp. M60BS1]